MKNLVNVKNIGYLPLFALLSVGITHLPNAAKAQADIGVKNIILVHGAFVDGSGWKSVYQILTEKGYQVTVTQNPLSSLEDDVTTVLQALEKQDGPAILVGHSYGGCIITEAGNSEKVAGLVYVAAFQPEAGESGLALAQTVPDLSNGGILPPDAHGIFYYDKEKFHAGFCADLSKKEADFMYASQGRFSVNAFNTPISKAAWKTKPTWAIIANEDKSINPVLHRQMSERSGAVVTEIDASHVVFISQPKAVAKVIETAAKGALMAKDSE